MLKLKASSVSHVHRRHPVSMAVSMVLLAAAATATSALAAESASAPAQEAGAQGSPQQGATTQAPADAQKAKPAGDAAGPEPGLPKAGEMEEVVVVGVRQSQIRAIEIKREAPNILDSI